MWFEGGYVVKLSSGEARSDQFPRFLPRCTVCSKDAMSDQRFEGFCSSLPDAEILELDGENRFHVDRVVGEDAKFADLLESEGVSVFVESLPAELEVLRVPEGFERVAKHAIAEERLLQQPFWFFASTRFGMRSPLQVNIARIRKPNNAGPDGQWEKLW